MALGLVPALELGAPFWGLVLLLVVGVGLAVSSYNREAVNVLLSTSEEHPEPVGTPLGGSATPTESASQRWRAARYGGLFFILLAWIGTILLYALSEMAEPLLVALMNFVFIFLSIVMEILEPLTDLNVDTVGNVLWRLAAGLGPLSILLAQL